MTVRLAWRSIWRHRRRTLITVASIALGLAFVIFWATLAEGIYAQLVDDAARMQAGHVTVEPAGYRDAPEPERHLVGVAALRRRLAALPGVATTKVLILGQGLARSSAGAVGVAVMGVEPAAEAADSPLARHVIAGRYLSDDDAARVVVGADLARRLALEPGRKLVLATNDVRGDLVEALFRVEGVFRTGAEEVDGWVVQAPLDAVRRLYGLGADEATQIGLVLRDPGAVRPTVTAARAVAAAPGIVVLPWQEVLPELAGVIRLDRVSDGVFQLLLLVLVLSTIFNTVLMSVLERRREFAVLLALGTPPRLLGLQVIAESAWIALVGCALGLLLGGGVAGVIQARGWDLSTLYREGVTISGFAMSTTVHARVTARQLLWLAGVVFVATLLLALPPMRRALRVPVAETLR